MKKAKPPFQHPRGLFDNVQPPVAAAADWWRMPDRTQLKATTASYRRLSVVSAERATVRLYHKKPPGEIHVAYMIVPHVDMTVEDRDTMLQSMVMIYNMTFFPSE